MAEIKQRDRHCLWCGKSLAFTRPNRKHCNNKCRQAEYRSRRFNRDHAAAKPPEIKCEKCGCDILAALENERKAK